MPINEQTFPRRYWAFISYSHKDSDIAEKWHKKLERYRVPNALVGTVGRDGVIPKSLFPIFRDRDELPTSSDLGTNLRDALGKSRFLIVIASPASASSRWVGEEVRQFKQVHGNGNVLVLITSGEPNATDQGRPAEECFCPSLRFQLNPEGKVGSEPSEPIAADIRTTGDGESRAFLKIVAGLIGVSFDDLFQRERRRQRQRMLVLSSLGTLLAAALLMIIAQLSFVGKKQDEMIGEQGQIREAVSKLKESGAYREIGKLPKDRQIELEVAIQASGITSFIDSLAGTKVKDFRDAEHRLDPLRNLLDQSRVIVTKGILPEGTPLKQALVNWLAKVNEESAKLAKIKNEDDLHGLGERYFDQFVKRFKSIWDFPRNLEEKLVVEDLYGEMQNQFIDYYNDYLAAPINSERLEGWSRDASNTLKQASHPFSTQTFSKEVEFSLSGPQASYLQRVEATEKALQAIISMDGHAPVDFIEIHRGANLACMTYKEAKTRLDRTLENVGKLEPDLPRVDVFELPDYYDAFSAILNVKEQSFNAHAKRLEKMAKSADDKIIRWQGEPGRKTGGDALELESLLSHFW